MIEDLRWVIQEDGSKKLQAHDGHVWFYIEEIQWFQTGERQ